MASKFEKIKRFFRSLSIEEIVQPATLRSYVDFYGYDLNNLSFQIRQFYIDCHEHFDRLALRDSIANHLNLNMELDRDRDSLWNEVVLQNNPYKKYGYLWKTGQEDMPLKWLRSYATLLGIREDGFASPKFNIENYLEIARFSISRTIVFIRLMPPIKTKNLENILPDYDMIPEELKECWKIMRSHPSYRNCKLSSELYAPLNQHALDLVKGKLTMRYWLESYEIGQLKLLADSQPSIPEVPYWYLPFLLFKYATSIRIDSTNFNVDNPYSVLWHSDTVGFTELWGT